MTIAILKYNHAKVSMKTVIIENYNHCNS